MKTIYWSPWINAEMYPAYNLCFKEPTSLLETLKHGINHENKLDNYFKCPGFLNYVKNIYTLNAPFDIDAELINGQFYNQLYQRKSASIKDAETINIATNWIFFAEDTLYIESMPPFMHNLSLHNSGFYVPGTFDISKWFRPLEYAYQLWPGVTTLQAREGDPLIYLKVNTEEPVEFKRFYMTDRIRDISKGCIRMKQFKSIKNLSKLYDIFTPNYRKLLLKEIKNNLVV